MYQFTFLSHQSVNASEVKLTPQWTPKLIADKSKKQQSPKKITLPRDDENSADEYFFVNRLHKSHKSNL